MELVEQRLIVRMYQTVIGLKVVAHHKYREVETYCVLQLVVKVEMPFVMAGMAVLVAEHQGGTVNLLVITVELMVEMEQMELPVTRKAEPVKEEQRDLGVVVVGLSIPAVVAVAERLVIKDIMELVVTMAVVMEVHTNMVTL